MGPRWRCEEPTTIDDRRRPLVRGVIVRKKIESCSPPPLDQWISWVWRCGDAPRAGQGGASRCVGACGRCRWVPRRLWAALVGGGGVGRSPSNPSTDCSSTPPPPSTRRFNHGVAGRIYGTPRPHAALSKRPAGATNAPTSHVRRGECWVERWCRSCAHHRPPPNGAQVAT